MSARLRQTADDVPTGQTGVSGQVHATGVGAVALAVWLLMDATNAANGCRRET